MEKYMRYVNALAIDNVVKNGQPFGACIVHNDKIIAEGVNETHLTKDVSAHAEMIALRQAAENLGGWRLLGCNLYVTAEPCAMCAGAIVWSRIEKLYIGTMDPKGGACGSVFNIPQEPKLNHYVEIETGILQEECQQILKTFFKELRKKKSEERKS